MPERRGAADGATEQGAADGKPQAARKARGYLLQLWGPRVHDDGGKVATADSVGQKPRNVELGAGGAWGRAAKPGPDVHSAAAGAADDAAGAPNAEGKP